MAPPPNKWALIGMVIHVHGRTAPVFVSPPWSPVNSPYEEARGCAVLVGRPLSLGPRLQRGGARGYPRAAHFATAAHQVE